MPVLKPNTSPWLTKEICEKLSRGNIRTVLNFILADYNLLMNISQLSYKAILQIKNILCAQYASHPMNAADMFEEMLSKRAIYSSGCQNVDRLLNGGIFTGDLTEIIGPSAAGKTQFCLSVMIQVALVSKQCCFYIDTNGSVTNSRIRDFAKSTGASQQEITEFQKERVRYASVHDVFDLFTILEQLRSDLNKQSTSFHHSLRLIIVDSINPLLTPLLGGSHTTGWGLMVQVASLLKCLSTEYSLALVITNNSVRIENTTQFKAALGAYWQHVPNVRLLVTSNECTGYGYKTCANPTNVRDVTLMKGTRCQTGQSTKFRITEKGIEDC